ncbi:zinc-binding dehydrogenase [Sphingobacterium spiritivorum]|uniref:zinc-binding dehydrogenase n=1 Tax=Sphingobacterium spiritivorum TaxID=258 RepID=UPI003DA6412B
MIKQGNFLVFEQSNAPLALHSLPVRSLSEGEILVKICYTTLCGSDLHTYCGMRQEPCPTILGHEIVGVIEDIAPDYKAADAIGIALQKGDLVTWTVFASDPQTDSYNPDIPQKNTPLYKYGHRQLTEADSFHGGLATHIILRPHTCIRKLSASLPLPVAATINCAVATAAGAIRLAGSVKSKRILISGMGLLGLVCAAMCKEAGAACIIVSDMDQNRLELARKFGADQTFSPTDQSEEITNSLLVDCFFDMSGSPEAMESGIDHLTVGGYAVLIGAVFKQRKLQIDAEQIIRRILTIRGLHNYNYSDFNTAVDFITDNLNKYPFTSLIEKEFSLEEINEAFAYAIDKKPVRVGILIHQN